MANNLTLYCLVDGEPVKHAFKLRDIPSSHDVDDLKDAIKHKKPNEFRDVDANELTLYRVSIHDDGTYHDKTELNNPRKRLLELFTKSPDDNTYIIVQQPLPGDFDDDIKRIAGKFFASGSPAATFLERFVQGHEQLPLTTGIVPGLPRVWLRKNSRRDKTRPSLLFLQLPDPSSSSEPSKGLSSDAILDLIGKCSTGNVPIFGVSGCGKTRSMMELLCRQWGFYFNASGDDLGSDDMTTLLAQVGSRLEKDRSANNRYARTMTYLLFLSRLLILQFCLKVQNSSRSFTSARWTLLQTCPHMFTDIFEHLFQKFLPLYQRSTTEERVLMDIVRKEFQVTRTCLIEHGGAPRFLDGTKLLVAHDEAQILGEESFGRFVSMNGAKADRPLLSPILHGFRNFEDANELTLLTSGTGLSVYTLAWARSSRSTLKHEPDDFAYIEFPGWTDRQSIETYIASLRSLLQDEDAKQALDMLLPSEAIDMMMERLVGRFRPIVAVIERTIENGKPDAWRDAIDDTEKRLVSYDFQRVPGNLIYELMRIESKHHKNLQVIKGLPTVERVLGLLLFQRYMFGANKLVLKNAVPELVERSFGRIKIVDGDARTVLDEPFALKAAENYFRMLDSNFMETTDFWMQETNSASAQGFAWELMMMNVLAETFKASAISDWSHEPKISSLCATLEGNAEIVAAIIPVFVQLKLRHVLSKADSNGAVDSVSKQKINEDVKDLDEYCPTNVYVSMIIAYPANVIDLMCPRPDIDFEAIAARRASLRSGSRKNFHDNDLQRVTLRIDQRNFAKIFPKGHVDFMDGIKTPVKRPAVDKQEQDDPKRTKIV
ncbi:hypothetical protein EC957_009845 [Mortierella hygrophila]|uniref:Crinkler effector protein N-terminal domain-containing protein n=1 Tax=Mortierella hygrophila TaxID=979708 RepID=A0A9P6F9V1_9FUNG|nr:hypothetical protein EC957_009845 [Mortierella hygrophila]